MNDAVRAVFLASAQKADLDQIGAAFNVERMVIVPANPEAVPPTDLIMEGDDAFRERIQLSGRNSIPQVPAMPYRFHARSADEDVLDADAYGPEEHGRAGRWMCMCCHVKGMALPAGRYWMRSAYG
nr:hypothetical protein [Escherichia coli]